MISVFEQLSRSDLRGFLLIYAFIATCYLFVFAWAVATRNERDE